MNDKLLDAIRVDLQRFRDGDDPTLDVENIYDLITEFERLTVELTHRVGWEERCLDAEAAVATLRAENARLRGVLDEIAAEDDE